MARVYTQANARRLGLAGRTSLEIVSAAQGEATVTFRMVEIPVAMPGEKRRNPHRHLGFEECIFVLAGEGITWSTTGEYPVKTGDTILIPAGEPHVTRNVGSVPLMLLCFFPVPNIVPGTEDVAFPDQQAAVSR